MPEQLKKCPFCGGDVWMEEEQGDHPVICRNCHLYGPDQKQKINRSEEQAAEEWNSRPLEDALQKRVEELEEGIDELAQEADSGWVVAKRLGLVKD